MADKNTIIGISLIALILIAFNFINLPSKEEIEKAKAQQEQVYQNKDTLVSTQSTDTTKREKVQSNTKLTDFADAYMSEAGEEFVLENDLIRVHVNERGGRVGDVFLKNYKSYAAFASSKDEPLQLMDTEHNVNELTFEYQGKKVYTRNLRFEVQEKSANKLVMRISKGEDKYIEYTYELPKNSYHLKYNINIVGFDKDVKPEDVMLHWRSDLLLSEKAPQQERNVSTIFFHDEKGYDY